MGVQNKQIAQIFDRIATLLELNGASTFRIRAYQNAARLVEPFPKPVNDMLAEGKDLTDYQGIGKDLEKKIEIAAKTGIA